MADVSLEEELAGRAVFRCFADFFATGLWTRQYCREWSFLDEKETYEKLLLKENTVDFYYTQRNMAFSAILKWLLLKFHFFQVEKNVFSSIWNKQ